MFEMLPVIERSEKSREQEQNVDKDRFCFKAQTLRSSLISEPFALHQLYSFSLGGDSRLFCFMED